MAHNINTYIGRRAAWHSLGTVTGKYQTWEEIQNHGGLNFIPVKEQLEHNGNPVEAWGIFRPDTGAFLGAVGDQYTVIDHAQGFRMIDQILANDNGAHYETAGCLGLGEVVWGLADINVTVNVGTSGDISKMYLLFATSHNGTFSHLYKQTATRVVCQNTLNIALSGKTASMFRVRHTANAQKRLDAAHDALAMLDEDAKTVEQKLNFLASRRVTRDSMTSILDRLFAPKRKDENGEAKTSTRTENILADVLRCYENNDGNVFPEQRGTAYNLLNAITEYTDHFRSTRSADKGESAMFGSGDRLKTQALEVILESANGMQVIESRPVIFTPAPVVADVSLLDQILSSVN